MRPVRLVASIGARMPESAPGSRVSAPGNEKFMRSAIEAVTRGLLAGEPPIGACLVKDGEIIVRTSNAVIGELDITAHAEMRVIRQACRHLRALRLSGCRLFVTVEPCPMCMSACYYADISEVVYGARLADLHALTQAELRTSGAREFSAMFADHATVHVTGDCLRNECRSLLEQWAGRYAKAP